MNPLRIHICKHLKAGKDLLQLKPKTTISSSSVTSSISSLRTAQVIRRQQFPRVDPTITTMASATRFYDFVPKDKKDEDFPMSQFKGKVVLVVNVASNCGFTKQYSGLETLYKNMQEKHPDEFTILGFPCNQFGGQEPGSNDEIQDFCQLNFGVTFPVLGKIDVNGNKAEPLYEWLKNEKKSLGLARIKWNFEKFLISRDGKVVNRWASVSSPQSLEKSVLAELEKKATMTAEVEDKESENPEAEQKETDNAEGVQKEAEHDGVENKESENPEEQKETEDAGEAKKDADDAKVEDKQA